MDKRAMISDLLVKRGDVNKAMEALVDAAAAETRSLTVDEAERLTALETERRGLDERAAELDAQVRADDAAADMQKRYAPSGHRVISEPEVYRSGPAGKSYFRDLHLARSTGDRDAIDRLARNNKARAEARALTTVNGAGGEFVPPLWLETEFVKLARPGRITADRVPTQELPGGTDSITIPKVATGTATAVQTTQNTAIQQTDLATTSISSSVVTIAGGQTLSLQLIEQSPLNVDDMVLSDLAAAYAVNLNTQVLSGSGTAGQLMGMFTLSGTNAIALTATTAAGLYSAVANGIQTVHTNRFMPPDTILMHPRRWAWLASQSDSTGRPLVVPAANSPMNALGNAGDVVAQGYVGSMLGLPVFVDATIPTNIGAGTNQDRVIVARMSDLVLWEGNVKAEAFPQTYANQLSVFVRMYNYASFQPARFPKSISVVDGAGLVTPTF